MNKKRNGNSIDKENSDIVSLIFYSFYDKLVQKEAIHLMGFLFMGGFFAFRHSTHIGSTTLNFFKRSGSRSAQFNYNIFKTIVQWQSGKFIFNFQQSLCPFFFHNRNWKHPRSHCRDLASQELCEIKINATRFFNPKKMTMNAVL